MSDFESWTKGEPLNFAFFAFGDVHQREQVREPSDPARTHVLTRLMFDNLFGYLGCGQLIAYGFRIAPTVSDGPVQIPSHCFEIRPNSDECLEDVITASGWRYERVRIIQPTSSLLEEVAAPQDLQQLASKSGRPSTYAAASATLRALHSQDPALIKQSASRLLASFNKEYPDYARELGLASHPLSERTLRDHLNRFRQELAETGENDFLPVDSVD